MTSADFPLTSLESLPAFESSSPVEGERAHVAVEACEIRLRVRKLSGTDLCPLLEGRAGRREFGRSRGGPVWF